MRKMGINTGMEGGRERGEVEEVEVGVGKWSFHKEKEPQVP